MQHTYLNATAQNLAHVLVSNDARSELTELEVFAPLIGSWKLQVTNYTPDGRSDVVEADWTFGWALDGRALIDVWICPSRESRRASGSNGGEWGMSVRFWDPAIERFRSTWLGAANGWVIPFLGQTTDEGFQIESQEPDVVRNWIFSNINQDSFSWRAEEANPEDGSLFVRQRFEATRI